MTTNDNDKVFIVMKTQSWYDGYWGDGYPVAAFMFKEDAEQYILDNFPFSEAFGCRFAIIAEVPFYTYLQENKVTIS